VHNYLHLYRHKDSRDQEYQKLTPTEFQHKLYLVSDKASVVISALLRGKIVQMYGHTFRIELK
jgi:hypothetical protein